MKLSQLGYTLPKKLIAHSPTEPRDHARLLVLDRQTGARKHMHFYDLPDLLSSTDVIVFNDTKVFPARLIGKKESGGRIEILLLRETLPNRWTAIHKGKLSLGQKVIFPDANAVVVSQHENKVELEFTLPDFWEWLYAYGQIPIPPYISPERDEGTLRNQYQTVYSNLAGSVAAPTAGLHFTKELIQRIQVKGVQVEYLTLHVGLGTFLPIKTKEIQNHQMHKERFVLDSETAARLNLAKKQDKRVIAVGTTSTRVLETCAKTSHSKLVPQSGETDIFMYPPYKFEFVDAMITNFHLPHSTLLALISAFVSHPNANAEFTSFKESIAGKAYLDAIENNYRFYSFGDGMFII